MHVCVHKPHLKTGAGHSGLQMLVKGLFGVWKAGQLFMCSCGSVPSRFGAALHPFTFAQSITLTP